MIIINKYILYVYLHVVSAHSPVLTHLNATLDGIHTIRAFSNQSSLISEFDGHYNGLTDTWFTHMAAFGWFEFLLNIAAGTFCGLATYSCLAVFDLHLLGIEFLPCSLHLQYFIMNK